MQGGVTDEQWQGTLRQLRRAAGVAQPSAQSYRQESDALGAVDIPLSAYWGVHTARALANFPLSGWAVRPELVRAMALVKLACCRANEELGYLPQPEAQAIAPMPAARLPRAVWLMPLWWMPCKAGAGTSTNMNMNEVLANRAEELLGAALALTPA